MKPHTLFSPGRVSAEQHCYRLLWRSKLSRSRSRQIQKANLPWMRLSKSLSRHLTRLLKPFVACSLSFVLGREEKWKYRKPFQPCSNCVLRISRSVFRVTLPHATTASTSVVHPSLHVTFSFLVKIYTTPGETPLYNVLHLSGWKHPSKAFSTLGRFGYLFKL